jgi:predicted ATPase/DNA-binding CsgD family transcriptional regulator
VTFLFTDVEGSTRLWEGAPAAMRAALVRHDEILRAAFEAHSGYVFSTAGDGFAAAFARAGDALEAARELQRNLSAEVWPAGAALRVRAGLHTGEVEERGGDYFGPAVNRAARLMAAGHGAQVLCSEATAVLVDGEFLLVDLGQHHLRDVHQPVRVFQVGEGDFPPLRSPATLPGGPWRASRGVAPVTGFFGRERELELLEEVVPRARLVSLIGVGGAGKTRLAWKAAERLGDGFADGVARVDLAPVGTADLVVRSVAQAAGVFDASADREGDRAIERRLLTSLADRNLLLVVDDCEHVIAEVARLCGLIMAACHEVCVLATSREPLGLAGEQRVVVGALERNAARELFYDRAQAVGASLDRSVDEGFVEAICDRVDRLALAVELAAARTRMMSLPDIERRLDDTLQLLVSAERTASGRQATMLAAIEWSHDLLDDDERTLFSRLGVFSGGWRLSAAEEVCGKKDGDPGDVVDVLGRLVDKSLVTVDTVTGRYRLLEPIRQYAWARLLSSGEAPAVVAGHRRHYRRLAQEVNASILRSGLSDDDWAELANFRAAIDRALDARDGRRALGVFVSLGWYWVALGMFREAVEWGRRALVDAAELEPRLELTGQAMVAGFLAYSGRPREAVPHADRAMELLASAPENYGARYLLSTALECLGRSPVEVLEHAEEGALTAGDRAFASQIANSQARYYMLMWRAEEAIAPLSRARGYVDQRTAVFAEELAIKQLALDVLLARPVDAGLLSRLEEGRVGRWRIASSSEDRCLALALAGDPGRAVAAIGVETRSVARAGFMQRVVLHLAYAAVARARLGQGDVAATLTRAAHRSRQRLDYEPLTIMEHIGADQLRKAVEVLGPSAASRAARLGDELDVDAAVDLACTPVPALYAGPLSSREAELMGLLTQGLDNTEIAEALMVSRRTVDADLSHIRTKLTLTSRAALIRWALDHDLR